jgi:hypothetical protein
MSNILNDFSTGIITISDDYDSSLPLGDPNSTPVIGTQSPNNQYIVSFIELEKVRKFDSFTYSSEGELETRYLDTFYRISRNGNQFTDWFELNQTIDNFPPFDPLDKMWIDIKWVRNGSKQDGNIKLTSYQLNGTLKRSEVEEGTISVPSGGEVIFRNPFIYKVFRIDNFEIIPSSLSDIIIHYRFSQDSTRTWSNWELLTKENISTVRINPIRFFQIEYKVTNNSASTVNIQDLNLIGDFQNVSEDYQKTNLFGIRECCLSNLNGAFDENGNFIPSDNGTSDGQSCTTDNGLAPMTAQEKANLYNPYQQGQANELLNRLSNDAMEVFGHRVQYFVTDPDAKGIDYSLHEYGTFNVSCEGELKVAVDNNQFPDNQITMNQFDLNLFDSFEIHITKESFKTLFGVQRRPSKEDMVYFCDLNRLFIVDHAQPFRSFNNYSVYYKVILRKYNKRANVKAGSQTIEDRINQLTKNSTIDELFGIENESDKAAIANKKEQQPLTFDPIRIEINGIQTNSLIIKELIENSNNIISKQHYDFSNALIGGQTNTLTSDSSVVRYRNLDKRLRVSDNIGFFVWFNINNYIEDEIHNLFNYYDDVNSLGWKVDLENDTIKTTLNSQEYSWILDGTGGVDSLSEGVWYCYLLNIDQRNRKLNQWIYKRNVAIEDEDEAKYLPNTILQKVYEDERDLIPFEYELEGINAEIKLSDKKMTNIRLFADVIPESEHNKLLNQYIIADDSKFLIFADNANLKLTLPNFPFNGTSYSTS